MRRLLPVTFLLAAVLAGCGSDGDQAASSSPSTSPSSSAGASAPATTAAGATPKPAVSLPAELPTELVITDLTEGTGDPAEVGDTVEVNYVGVRSADGKEFDNSYDKGQTFPVTLGNGEVIQGWEQGLLGIKEGGRRQLDIPADLAYGDSPPPGDVIQPGDALSFIVDAVKVTKGVDVPIADPADKPQVEIPKSVGATELDVTDLVEGTGDVAANGQEAYVQIIAYRGDTGEELQSTWETGQPAHVALDDTTIPGLVDGIVGMKVGGRRLVVIPPEQAFGADGNEEFGLPAGTDLILVIDLVLLTTPDGS